MSEIKSGRGGAREGAGRKSSGVAGKTAMLSIRISPEEKAIIDEKAKQAGKSTTRYIIDLALNS